jgi:hypothetical protein
MPLKEYKGTNFRFLENDSVEIGGYRFFGCTLWSDMELLNDQHTSTKEFRPDFTVVV